MALCQKMLVVKRAKFVSKIHSLNQEFHYTDTSTELRVYDIRGAKKI